MFLWQWVIKNSRNGWPYLKKLLGFNARLARLAATHAYRILQPLPMAAKRLLLAVLCLCISGISSVYMPEHKRTSTDPAHNQYWVSMGPVAGSTAAAYTYASFFNPANSGKTLVVKHIKASSYAVAAAVFQDLFISRTTAASAGTQIAAVNIPKKHSASANSTAEVRYAGVTTTLVGGATDNRPMMAFVAAAAAGWNGSSRDYTFSGQQVVLQPGEGIALHQTAAGDADQRVRLDVEWEEVTSAPAASDDFMLALPRVGNAGAVDYKYHTFFNPAVSGKTAVVSRLNLDVDCGAAGVYTNQIYIRRVSAASAGTLVTSATAAIPKRHSGAATSVIEARHTTVTATLSGTVSSSLGEVTPCGAVNQPHGHLELIYGNGNENLILQPGEGIAVTSDAAGNANNLIRLSAVWSEQAAAPASQGEYAIAVGPVSGSTTSGYNYASFFNPAASGKTMVVRKLGIRVDAVAAAVYVPMTIQRAATAPTAGTLITAADIPKKHSGTGTSAAEIRHTGVTFTNTTTPNARVMGVTTPGAVGQITGIMTRDFTTDNPLVLQPGQGLVLFQEAAGDADHRVRLYVEWDEEASVPATFNDYMLSTGPVAGSTTSGYNYASFYNPAASGKTVTLNRLTLRTDAAAAAVYVPLSLQRITSATVPSGGTAIAVADVPKKHTSGAISAMDIRTAGPTVSKLGGAAARINSVTTPGAVPTAVSTQISGYSEYDFTSVEKIVIQPGEGIVLFQEAAGDADFRVRLQMEWNESASTPSSQGEYVFSTGAVTGTATAGQTYATFYNPSTTKKLAIKRLEIRVDRAAAGTAFVTTAIRRLAVAPTGGTAIAAADIPKMHTGSANSGADIRTLPTTPTYANAADSRYLSITTPGAVGQDSGLNEAVIYNGDELVIGPGQGIGLYQETAGDTGLRFYLRVVWSEISPSFNQASYRFFNNQDTANTTNFTAGSLLTVGTTPASTAVGDFNGDGKPDLATANWGAKTVTIHFNNGSGGYASSTISGLTNGPLDIVSGDFNGDGVPDLATANGSGNNVYIFLNNGSGIFALSSTVAVGTNPQFMTTADFTGDGKPDLATSNYSANTVSVLTNSGTGTFTVSSSPAVGTFPEDIVAADFTGDGKYDIATVNNSANTVSILTNGGTGTFTLSSSPAVGTAPNAITAGDFNGDGKADIATSNTTSQTVSVLLNNGTGTFTLSSSPAVGTGLDGVVSADFNGDGKYDIATSNNGNNTVSVFLSDGSGGFTLSSNSSVGAGPGPITTADLNGDGKPDLVEPNATDATVSILLWSNPVDVGTALAAQNTAATSLGDGQPFRMRMDIGISSNALLANDQLFKLQYAPMTTSCDTSFTNTPTSAYQDVTTSSTVRYYDNPNASSGAALTSNANDPLDGSNPIIRETYQEAGTTTFTNPTAISTGNDGMWDFALTTKNTLGGQSYCIRVVLAASTPLTTYAAIPQINIPNTPSTMNQSGYRWFNNLNETTFSTITNNVTTGADATYAAVKDGDYFFTASYESTGGNDWHIEKRNMGDGQLVSGFGTSGVVSSSPSTADDRLWGIDVDSSYIYVAGQDASVSATDMQWRIEKRDKITGALVSAFGASGVMKENPTTGNDIPYEVKVYGGALYIVGIDSTGANQWRIEKRDTTTGALISGFGTGGIVTEDPSTGSDRANTLAIDSTGLYIGGYDLIPSNNNQIRIEKRDLTTGALISGFGTGGIITENIYNASTAIVDDAVLYKGLAVNGSDLYVAGTDYTPGNMEWRIEKRDTTTGGLVSGFGTGGAISVNFSTDSDSATSIRTDGSYLYVGGSDRSFDAGFSAWRIEKRDLTTGALVSSFANAGAYTSNPSTNHDELRDMFVDNSNIYAFGYDYAPANYELRIEKVNTVTGSGPGGRETALANQNTAAKNIYVGQNFRLRLNIAVDGNGIAAAGASQKLQYAERSGTCDTGFSGETYADVTAASPISYLDNSNLTDGSAMVPNISDPTDGTRPLVRQTYEESNNFSNSTAIYSGQDGMWDFAMTDSSAPQGTGYCFRVVNSDGSLLDTYSVLPELTTPMPPNPPSTLIQAKTDGTVVASGGWANSTSIKFSALASENTSSAMLQLCVEKKPIASAFAGAEDSCGSAVSFIGTAVPVTVTISGMADATEYHWQARIKDADGLYSPWVSYDTNAETASDFGTDTTAPTGGMAYDGTSAGVDASFNDGSLSALSANWSGISADVSGLAEYQYSIGTSASATDVKGWSSTGTTPSVTATGLTLQTSNKYFFNVRITDNAGNTAVIFSDGQLVAPTVSFSVSPSTITLNNLNPGNSFTDTKTTTLTTSTNAYGGYVVRSFMSDLFRSTDNKTIGGFTGGTYNSPDSWQSGDTGFGYTSSDTLVQSVNKFQSATCLGGSVLASPGCYAPFATSGIGDIIADHTASVSGAPITNQSFTITYRATTTNTQAATKYNTNVVYTITPIY
jgi:hypothetical protein